MLGRAPEIDGCFCFRLRGRGDEDLVRVSGGQTGPGLPRRDRHQGDARQLREVQRRHLQRARDHRLVRQLHGAQEPPDPPGQVRQAATARRVRIQTKCGEICCVDYHLIANCC